MRYGYWGVSAVSLNLALHHMLLGICLEYAASSYACGHPTTTQPSWNNPHTRGIRQMPTRVSILCQKKCMGLDPPSLATQPVSQARHPA